jgi:hypothetical protein
MISSRKWQPPSLLSIHSGSGAHDQLRSRVNAARRFALPFGAKRSRFPSAGTRTARPIFYLSIPRRMAMARWTTPAAPAQPSEELKPESAMGTKRNLQQDLDRSSHGGSLGRRKYYAAPSTSSTDFVGVYLYFYP